MTIINCKAKCLAGSRPQSFSYFQILLNQTECDVYRSVEYRTSIESGKPCLLSTSLKLS